MSGDGPRGRDMVPESPFAGIRDWMFASQIRLQLFVVLVVLMGTIGVGVGALVFFGVLPVEEPPEPEPTTPPPTATPSPTPTATPSPTPTTTPRDVVGRYRAATVVGTTTGGYVSLRFPDGDVRQLPLAGVHVPGAGGASPARFDGVVEGRAGRACLGDYGSRAAVTMASQLDGERVGVRVVDDPTVPGGTGVYVRNGGEVVNRELVRLGYARARTDEYRDLMIDAREGDRGLWECGTVEPMAADEDVAVTVEISPENAADEGGIRVVEVRPNPPDGAPLAVETLTIRNTGTTTVDLDGWVLGNENGAQLTLSRFPSAEDRRLQPGERLVVHTGTGAVRDGHLYLAESHQLWGDAGGIVRLTGPSYRRSVTVRYGDAARAGNDTRHLNPRRPFTGR